MTTDTAPERPLGLTLKLERIEMGVSLTELSNALGVSVGHLSRIEAGQRTASAEMVERIRAAVRAAGGRPRRASA